MEQEFIAARERLSGDRAIFAFNQKLKTRLITDASRLHGFGYVLLQLDPNAENRWKLIKAGSCSITETQQRYATIELEMMAIVFGCNQCKHYITGLQNLEIVTDHRPLLGVLKRDLKDVQNMRLHRF